MFMTVDPKEWKDLYSISLVYIIHAVPADLQTHILLLVYDITISQSLFRLFLFLLNHPLSLTTLPSHAVICVLSSFSQSIYKNLT